MSILSIYKKSIKTISSTNDICQLECCKGYINLSIKRLEDMRDRANEFNPNPSLITDINDKIFIIQKRFREKKSSLMTLEKD